MRYFQIIFLDRSGQEVFRLKTWGKDPRDALIRLPEPAKERIKRRGAVRYRWEKLR